MNLGIGNIVLWKKYAPDMFLFEESPYVSGSGVSAIILQKKGGRKKG